MRACLVGLAGCLFMVWMGDQSVGGWWQSSFHRWEMCPTSCLNRRLMGGPVAVLSIGFHMHKMGTSGEVMVGR